MPLPTVWPEHPEVAGVIGYHDCTQCAALMCLIYSGFTAFPLGAYTVAERNALDASDDRPDNTGATLDGSVANAGWLDKQLLTRYGVRMHLLPDDSRATLRAALLKPGYGFVVQGTVGNWPVGSPLRRWQPNFNGGHAICVITGPRPRILDPLATLHYAGDEVSIDDVMQFAWVGNEYSRYLAKDELLSIPDTATKDDAVLTITIEKYPAPRKIVCYPPDPSKSGELWPPTIRAYQPPVHEVVKADTLKPDTTSFFHASGHAEVVGWSTTDPNKVFNYWVAADGYFAGLFVSDTNLTKPEPLPVTDCSAQEQTIKDQAAIIAKQKTSLGAKDVALEKVAAVRKADAGLDDVIAKARAA